MSLVFSIIMAIVTVSGAEVQASVESRAYQPFGAAKKLFYSREPEVLLSGPAGTGKSRALFEKLYFCAQAWPGSRFLIVRKTRSSLTESGLVTWEEKVLPPNSPVLRGTRRRYRQIYEFPNRSAVVVGGMDEPSRVMSTEFDLILAQEATELSNEDWENLLTRLRNGVMPFQQLVADCNPSGPGHWLKKRADSGVAQMIESRHEDNPRLYDQAEGAWTEEGAQYIQLLENLTGVRKLRLRHGLWAQAEGMVYADSWDPAVNLIDRFDVPRDWQRFLSIDFGYTNPFVCHWWAMDSDGRMFRYREIYQTRRLVEDHAREILGQMAGEPNPVAVVCDHDAEDMATLERHLGFGTTPAVKSISDGIQAVAGRMKLAGDGKARIFLLRDSLVERDQDLVDRKLPCSTEEEVEGYTWDEKKDLPLKREDHGCDAMRYAVMWADSGSEGIFL